jgi:hypothetical protein
VGIQVQKSVAMESVVQGKIQRAVLMIVIQFVVMVIAPMTKMLGIVQRIVFQTKVKLLM